MILAKTKTLLEHASIIMSTLEYRKHFKFGSTRQCFRKSTEGRCLVIGTNQRITKVNKIKTRNGEITLRTRASKHGTSCFFIKSSVSFRSCSRWAIQNGELRLGNLGVDVLGGGLCVWGPAGYLMSTHWLSWRFHRQR